MFRIAGKIPVKTSDHTYKDIVTSSKPQLEKPISRTLATPVGATRFIYGSHGTFVEGLPKNHSIPWRDIKARINFITR